MRRLLAPALLSLWAAVVLVGMIVLTRYSLAPGRPAAAPARWPTHSRVLRRGGRPTLLMIAHPRCACTRASLGELAVLMTRCTDRLDATVMFVRPPGAPSGWDETDLRHTAAAIPGVQVLTDTGGREAGRFGTWTSGQVFLYDAAGKLRFYGGITAGRGHAGDNAGRSALEALLLSGQPARPTTPVFGCELFDRSGPNAQEVAPACRN